MQPISVVIPCFNLGEYLPEAVESLRQQTVPTTELIIVDDGSTDEQTLDVLNDYRDDGVTVFTTSNQGAPAARNFGIARALGEHILCLDADDILYPSFIEELNTVLTDRRDVGIVTSHVELFGESTGIWKTSDYSPTTLLWQNCIASASLFRRRCWEDVGGYHDLPAYQDWEFWISVINSGWKWSVVPKTLYRYRVRPKSISEFGISHRRPLLKRIVSMHSSVYEAHVADILVEMDFNLRNLRQNLHDYVRSKSIEDDEMARLASIVENQRREIAELEALETNVHGLQDQLSHYGTTWKSSVYNGCLSTNNHS